MFHVFITSSKALKVAIICTNVARDSVGTSLCINEDSATRGQFHHHLTSSFHARRYRKRKKDSQIKQLFALLGPDHAKAAHRHIDEIDPMSETTHEGEDIFGVLRKIKKEKQLA